MIRKSTLIIVLVFVLLGAVAAYFIRDSYAERFIEWSAETVFEAKVEVDNFHYSIIGLNCSWDRLQIADKDDPWRNLIETGKAGFSVETRPLFWKRFVIKEMSLEGVRTGTSRTTSGALSEERLKEMQEPGFFDEATASVEKQLGVHSEKTSILNLLLI